MTISSDKKILDLQRAFYQKFPYLKVEFYELPPEDEQPSRQPKLIDPNQTIGEVRTIDQQDDVRINDQWEVSALEEYVRQNYGLIIQIWRRSGKVWLPTTTTRFRTLMELNEEGKQSVIHPV